MQRANSKKPRTSLAPRPLAEPLAAHAAAQTYPAPLHEPGPQALATARFVHEASSAAMHRETPCEAAGIATATQNVTATVLQRPQRLRAQDGAAQGSEARLARRCAGKRQHSSLLRVQMRRPRSATLPNAAFSEQVATAPWLPRGAAAAAAATARGRAGPPLRAVGVRRACRRQACRHRESVTASQPYRSDRHTEGCRGQERHEQQALGSQTAWRRASARHPARTRSPLPSPHETTQSQASEGHRSLSSCTQSWAHSSWCVLDAGVRHAAALPVSA